MITFPKIYSTQGNTSYLFGMKSCNPISLLWDIYRCPTNLSQYPFIGCYYKNSLEESSGGCYRIRDVPLDDRLIFMDANLTENCSEAECDEIKSLLF